MKSIKCIFVSVLPWAFIVADGIEETFRELPPWPYYRFKLWQTLTDSYQIGNASILSYNEATWNKPGSNRKTEKLSYESLQTDKPVKFSAVQGLGFTNSQVWDCYVNHYEDYDWTELKKAEVETYFLNLGWTEEGWGSNIAPITDALNWDDLLDVERTAAKQLCYTKELWDAISMEFWANIPVPPQEGEVTVEPTTQAPTEAPLTISDRPPIAPVDDIRYVLWGDLSKDIKSIAEKLNYTQNSWNMPGKSPIERFSYGSMGIAYTSYGIGSGNNTGAIEDMGLNEDEWDCHINHYDDYSWKELHTKGVQVFFSYLGWTRDTWENIHIRYPFSEYITWYDMTTEQREAAEAVCYRYELWDHLELSRWPQIINAKQDHDRNVYVDMLVLVLFAIVCFVCWASYMEWNSSREIRFTTNPIKDTPEPDAEVC